MLFKVLSQLFILHFEYNLGEICEYIPIEDISLPIIPNTANLNYKNITILFIVNIIYELIITEYSC